MYTFLYGLCVRMCSVTRLGKRRIEKKMFSAVRENPFSALSLSLFKRTTTTILNSYGNWISVLISTLICINLYSEHLIGNFFSSTYFGRRKRLSVRKVWKASNKKWSKKNDWTFAHVLWQIESMGFYGKKRPLDDCMRMMSIEKKSNLIIQYWNVLMPKKLLILMRLLDRKSIDPSTIRTIPHSNKCEKWQFVLWALVASIFWFAKRMKIYIEKAAAAAAISLALFFAIHCIWLAHKIGPKTSFIIFIISQILFICQIPLDQTHIYAYVSRFAPFPRPIFLMLPTILDFKLEWNIEKKREPE